MLEALRRYISPPGPSHVADGQTPADQSIRRLPLVVWGDAFPGGGRPQVRRALAGVDAHECMYAWVYLNELLTVRDMLAVPMPSTGMPMERFDALRAAVPDPQFQITEELASVFLPAAAFLAHGDAEFMELGSTFFASIEKLDLCGKLLGAPLDRADVLFSGVEYSPFLRRASRSFHPGDHIELVAEASQWRRSRKRVFHISRFVGSYAFRSTEAYARELDRADAFHIIDAFSLGRDFHSWDLGLPITFLDLEALAAALPDFALYLTKVTPEYHAAGQHKAMVVRLFGIRRATAVELGFLERHPPEGRPYASGVAAEIERSLSAEQWADFAAYKRLFPVWGGPPGYTKADLARLTAPTGADLHFDDVHASAIVRAAIQAGGWQPK